VNDRAAPHVLATGESRRDDAILPFKALARGTGGLLSACEFTLGGWASGPVLHLHEEVDEAFYVVRGKLEAQLGDQRVQAETGGFLWVPHPRVRLTPEEAWGIDEALKTVLGLR
jgi:mannose-6-phosphate isomerase-like protein (cupin superfamily)